jgi:hypothetical protein
MFAMLHQTEVLNIGSSEVMLDGNNLARKIEVVPRPPGIVAEDKELRVLDL